MAETPKIVYHYTTQAGLLGILQAGTLWATKIHYLNDASELVEPLRLADQCILEKYGRIYDSGDPDEDFALKIIDNMLAAVRGAASINICLVSFCTNGDLLSQWRGYGNPGCAYSIGFNTSRLNESIAARGQGFELRSCTYYDRSSYEQEIRRIVYDSFDIARSQKVLPLNFIGHFIERTSTMKLDCFQEEDEWRLVSTAPISFSDNNFCFRFGKSFAIPYYSLSFDVSSISEIIVGPCPHPDLSADAVNGLACKFDLEEVWTTGAKLSKIPYRVP